MSEWKWNVWDSVHCVECGADLPAQPRREVEHFCSKECAYCYGVNFHGHMYPGERQQRTDWIRADERREVFDRLIAEAERGAATVSAFGHDGSLAEYLRHRQGGE